MTLFAVGSWVCIADNTKAQVRQICISEEDNIEYECVWWNEATRNTEWLSAFEVRAVETTLTTQIGFKQ